MLERLQEGLGTASRHFGLSVLTGSGQQVQHCAAALWARQERDEHVLRLSLALALPKRLSNNDAREIAPQLLHHPRRRCWAQNESGIQYALLHGDVAVPNSCHYLPRLFPGKV